MRLVRAIDAFTDLTGRAIAWLMFAMVVVTLGVVILRYGFDQSSILAQESVMYMHAVAFMLGIPYTLKHDGHVRVDIIYSRLSLRGRTIIDLLGHLLFLLPLCVLMLVFSWDYVGNAWRIREGSPEVGGIPGVYLLKSLIPLLAIVLLLQAVAEIVRSAALLGSRRSPGT